MAAEAGGIANQPTEQAGMSAEVLKKLQDKATVLTQERKKRGRTVPEELTTQDDLRSFRTLASHPVRLLIQFLFYSQKNIIKNTLAFFSMKIYKIKFLGASFC